ncbi:hypothetical protein, partial [Pseudomonas savastanoi]|uniref:hypothetical protein n=1 Tax=Pseudomonas savastanoi TaxID=29438 RepID=UPI001F1C440F
KISDSLLPLAHVQCAHLTTSKPLNFTFVDRSEPRQLNSTSLLHFAIVRCHTVNFSIAWNAQERPWGVRSDAR